MCCAQALLALPADAAAAALSSLRLHAALALPAALTAAYLRGLGHDIAPGRPALTSHEVCRLAACLHHMRSCERLELTMRHAAFDPLSKRILVAHLAAPAPSGLETLCIGLPFLCNLRDLGLSDCQAGPAGAAALAHALPALSQLRALRFARNYAGVALAELAGALTAVSALRELDLSSNGAPPAVWQALTSTLRSLTALDILTYASTDAPGYHLPNQLAAGGDEVVHPLAAAPMAAELRFSGAASWAAALPPGLAVSTSLRSLELKGNQLSAVGAAALLRAAAHAPALQTLQLSTDSAAVLAHGSPTLTELSEAARAVHWPALQELRVHCAATGSVAEALMDALPPLAKLTALHVSLACPADHAPSSLHRLERFEALCDLAVELHAGARGGAAAGVACALFRAAGRLPYLTRLHFGASTFLGCPGPDQPGRGLQHCTSLRVLSLACQVCCSLLGKLRPLKGQLQSVHVKEIELDETIGVRLVRSC